MSNHMLHKFSFEESYGRYRRVIAVPSKCRKNLSNLLPEEEEETAPMIAHVKVYLRIKPLHRGDLASIDIRNDHTLIMCPPVDRQLKIKSSSPYSFQFSKIYGPETVQKEIFEGSVLPLVYDFLKGKDALLFAYGTSSAGKTFTMQGDEKHPGVIPRTLDMLFNSLQDKVMPHIRYKPITKQSMEVLSDELADMEYRMKEKILGWNPQSVLEGSQYIQSVLHDNTRSTESSIEEISSGASSLMKGSSAFFIPEALKKERNSILLPADSTGVQYSVWVSFAEVYNESVYDLLDFLPGKGPMSNMKRPKLNLVTDLNGNTYIKGLQEVCVSSGDEACQVMLLGKCNLHFAATKLNHKSSRSHCVFTVKLLRMSEVDGEEYKISTLSFCDLAGSERVEKSGNVGERLKETGNINTSLLVLGRCLKALRNNQVDGKNLARVPFRESKLTRLFQDALTGNGNVAMIVNVSPSPLLYEETLNVLKYAAVAQEIVLEPMEIRHSCLNARKSRFSVLAAKHRQQHQASVMILDPIEEAQSISSSNTSARLNEEMKSLQNENSKLKSQLEQAESECQQQKDELRRYLCSNYKAIINDMQQTHSETVEEIKSDLTEYYTTIIQVKEQRYLSKIQRLELECNSEKENGEQEHEEVSDDNYLPNKIDELTQENHKLKAMVEKLNASEEDRNRADLEKEEEISQMKNENSSLKLGMEVLRKKVKELEETLQDGYVEFSTITETVTDLETELNSKNKAFAKMEMDNAVLREENEISDKLLQEITGELEIKEAIISEFENKMQSKEGSTIAIQCDLCSKEHAKEKQELENSVADMEKKLKLNESYYNEIVSGKDGEISKLEVAFKSLLAEKNDLQDSTRALKAENSALASRIISVERELTQSSKMLRGVWTQKSESKISNCDDSDAKKESLQMLSLLKEELETKRADIERLLNETQALRDAVDCKEKELISFQENQSKTLSNYETLLNKARDEVELHKREEKQLRALLQIGTPNKYEKINESLNDELSKLKKALSTVCDECLSRISLEDLGCHSLRGRGNISNENFDPRTRYLRRRSKSQTHMYIFDDSDDSDFVIERNPRGKKGCVNKTFTGHDVNKECQDSRYRPLSVERTPFKSSRRLMNPEDCSALSDFKDDIPLYPRTPADVIKRVLRPRRK